MKSKIKKISLLTFHSALSYGAVVQTYAMIKTIEALNCNVELINLKAPFSPKKPTGIWSLKNEFGIKKIRKRILFRKFRKSHFKNKTPSFYSLKSLKSYKFNSDLYIVGSDQVWNPTITKKYSKNYFFDFVDGHKISYAASFGKEEWTYNKDYTAEIKKNLAKFKSISVRETSGKILLKNKFNINSTVVLDPSFLYNDYQKLFKNFKQKEQLVSFKLNYNDSFLELVSNIQNKLNIPAFALDHNKKHKNITPIGYPSVITWLQTIAESSFIITDSFHGLVFSLIFQKKFIVVNAHPKRFTRIQSLLDMLNLTDRIVNTSVNTDINKILQTDINYDEVNLRLEQLKKESLNFIKSNI